MFAGTISAEAGIKLNAVPVQMVSVELAIVAEGLTVIVKFCATPVIETP